MDEETKGRLGVAMAALDGAMDEVETVKKYMDKPEFVWINSFKLYPTSLITLSGL